MGDCYDTVEQVLKDYVPKADLSKTVERWRDRQRHWSRWKVGKASTYETCADELDEIIKRGE